MNRRHFIQLSGTATAALLFSRLSFAQSGSVLINLPDEVWMQVDEGWQKASASAQSTYNYKDVQVVLAHQGNSMSVFVQSPTLSLSGIKLQWKANVTPATACLGDHWERTYGDVSFQKPSGDKKMPWYFVEYDNTGTYCYGVKTGANSFCYWKIEGNVMNVTLDTRSGGIGVQLGTRTLHAADVVIAKNKEGENVFATARRFCSLMCEAPRLPKKPVYGINDWYFAYGNNSYDLIIQHTSMLASLATDVKNIPFSVIDAGWALYSPYYPNDGGWQDDFSRPNDKFKDMHKMADGIKHLGMRPGLWTRPLCGKHDDPTNITLPLIPGRDNPKQPVLDPTIAENLARIHNNISLYKQWGYNLVKHDYTSEDIMGKWGFQMADDMTTPGWRFNDNTKTTAEIVLNLYNTIRDAADDMYIIGCNTFSHLSAGIFEMCRIGDDTSGKEWARTRKMGVNTMGFRMVQHNNFYAVDGDCVGLTKDVPWAKNKQWMQLLAQSSAPLFVSVQPDALGAEQKQYIKQSFASAETVQPIAEPLDWLTNQWPEKWLLDGKETTFDWND